MKSIMALATSSKSSRFIKPDTFSHIEINKAVDIIGGIGSYNTSLYLLFLKNK
ncbi:MAG: hypothetical protein JWR67_1685 [Mucilaginibacter sp.]|nr:hypothetical protein [Mucilaginibacter sp.]